MPSPPPLPDAVRAVEAWQISIEANLTGLVASREGGCLLAWDTSGTLYHMASDGEVRATWKAPAPLDSAAISADGRVAFALVRGGQGYRFDASLEVQDVLDVPDGIRTAALDTNGWHLGLALESGRNVVLDCYGRECCQFTSVQPFRHLIFLVEQPLILGCADRADVAAFDLRGRMEWHHGSLARSGGLTATHSGHRIVVPAFQEGLLVLDQRGQMQAAPQFNAVPCRADVTADGNRLLVAALDGTVSLVWFNGRAIWSRRFEQPPQQACIDPLGTAITLAWNDGTIARWTINSPHAPASPGPRALPTEPGPSWVLDLDLSPEETTSARLGLFGKPPRIALLAAGQLRIFPTHEKADRRSCDVSDCSSASNESALLLGDDHAVAVTPRSTVVYRIHDDRFTTSTLSVDNLSLPQLIGSHELIGTRQGNRLARMWLDGEKGWDVAFLSQITQFIGGQEKIAVVTADGTLSLLTLEGEIAAQLATAPGDLVAALGSIFLLSGASASPANHRIRAVSGDGKELWQKELPIAPERLQRVGRWVVASNRDGHACGVDAKGRILIQGPPEAVRNEYYPLPGGKIGRAFLRSDSLGAQEFTGETPWSRRLPAPVAGFASVAAGTALLTSGKLAWVASELARAVPD